MNLTLYVSSLASKADGLEVERMLCGHGAVVYAKVVVDRNLIGRRGGFGVAQMSTEEEALHAIRALHNSSFHGRTLTVRAATAAEESAAGHPRMFESMNMGDETVEAS